MSFFDSYFANGTPRKPDEAKVTRKRTSDVRSEAKAAVGRVGILRDLGKRRT
ncbi:hypothetical protein [Streptomyces sp. NPDC048272]|uniref:hypothetical protein n=1 Tax=Streptomyces sp. NPDC048272 TaxID=3154616 RepID=UPI003435D7A5